MPDDESSEHTPTNPLDETTSNGGSDESDSVADDSGPAEVITAGEWQEGGAWGGPGGIGGDSVRFTLRIPGFWSSGLMILYVLLAIPLFRSVLPGLWSGESGTFWGIVLGLEVLVAAGAAAYRYFKLPDEPQVIELGPKQATLPAGADSKGTTEVPYTDVRAVMIMRRGQSEWVMVETEEGRFGYAAEAFERPDGARRFRSAIMGRIRRHPEADRILDRMRQLEETAELATRNGTPVTYTLLALVIGIYVYEYASGALASEFGLLDLGAISTALIEQGQYFRLVSGSFLHGGFVHILFNGLALLFLGISIERMIGSWRFLLIFLVSALGGATGSYLWTEAPLAVGSSTALYGLIGAFGVLHVKYWDEMPPPYRQTVQWWAVILVLNIGISLLPMIDAAAHFAGMGVGIVATYLVTVDLPDMDPTSRAGTAIKIATAAMTALFAAGLAQASNYADSPHPDDRLRVVEYEVDRAVEAGDHRRLNRLAWRAATQPEPTVAELKLAQRAIRAALDERANGLRYLDTQATVFFRLARASEGERRRRRLERAIEIERRALREGEPIEPWAKKVARRWAGVDLQATVDRAVYWSQLARFLSVYRNDYGVYRPGDTSVTVSSVGRSAAGVGVSLAAESAADTEVLALLVAGDGRRGLVRFCVPAGRREVGTSDDDVSVRGETGSMPQGAEFRAAMVDASGVRCDGPTVAYWPSAASVEKLP